MHARGEMTSSLGLVARSIGAAVALLACINLSGSAEEKDAAKDKAKKKPVVVRRAGGQLSMTAPAAWVSKKPRTRIVEHEFAAPAAKGDKTDGRITIMGAGGSIDANIARWHDQFAPVTRSKRDKIKVAGMQVHLVDLTGKYKDRRGPNAPATLRKDYRMIGAIIETEKLGRYFVKMVAPRKTAAENEKRFKEMIKSLKAK